MNSILLTVFQKCTSGAAKSMVKFEQDQRLIQFLMGLNSDYNTVRGNILMMNPLPSISQAYGLVIQEENQREIHASTQFISESASMSVSNNQYQEKNDSKKTGHPVRKCYRLIGFHKDFKFTKGKNVQNQGMAANVLMDHDADAKRTETNLASFPSVLPGFTQEQYNKLVMILNKTQLSGKNIGESSTSQNCTSANFAGKVACSSHNGNANCVCFNCFVNAYSTWILDSGASDHMCHNRNLFVQTQTLSSPYHITLPNGHVVTVTQTGNIQISPDILLKHVLHVPHFKYNLLSINKLCQQLNCHVTFPKTHCVLQGLSLRKPLIIGEGSGGLYLLHSIPEDGLHDILFGIHDFLPNNNTSLSHDILSALLFSCNNNVIDHLVFISLLILQIVQLLVILFLLNILM